MTKSPKLIFFGNERLATGVTTSLPVLRALLAAGYEVVGIIVSERPGGASRRSRELEIEALAKTHQIAIHRSPTPAQILAAVKKEQPAIGVLAAYGRLVPTEVIEAFPVGIVNLHPSLLPKYRGPTPIETAILDGARRTGVSLMSLAAKLDAGPLYAKKAIYQPAKITKQALADRLDKLGAELLIKHLPAIVSGQLRPRAQSAKRATYSQRLSKANGRISWRRPATMIERQIRAVAGYPKAAARVGAHQVIITKARLVNDFGNNQLIIKCLPGYLEILELVAPSGRTMSGSDFKRGYLKKQ